MVEDLQEVNQELISPSVHYLLCELCKVAKLLGSQSALKLSEKHKIIKLNEENVMPNTCKNEIDIEERGYLEADENLVQLWVLKSPPPELSISSLT